MSQSIYFIDTKLSDYQSVIDSLSSTDTYYLIDSNQDGVSQIANFLSGYGNLDTLHIFSHGSIGSLTLGSTVLHQNNIASYQALLQSIGNSLTANGDILLYGCNVAFGDSGQTFIDTIAAYTGADVAASTDVTGSSALDGNWELEASSGSTEAATIAALSTYANTLAINTAPSFAIGDGKVTTVFGSSSGATSVILQPDGKILVAGIDDGDFALARYGSDGSLDTTFSEDGKVTTDMGTFNDYGSSVTIQADGKIVVAGQSNNDFVLARYNTDGSLDTTFDGDGKVETDFGSSYEGGYSVAVQSDGKILVGGFSNSNFAVGRYNSDGSLDATFGVDGKVITDFNSTLDVILSIVVQADGKILTAGYSSSCGYSCGKFALARYNSDGSLDTTFDSDGRVITSVSGSNDSASSVILQADGKILVAGVSYTGSSYDFALVRYNSDGSLDTTFDSDGKVTTPIGLGEDQSKNVTLQVDGKIVVAGFTVNGSNYDFALVRYNSDGSLDTTFGGDGKVTTDFGPDDFIQGATVQADGKIVVAGGNGNFVLARYNSDGSLDTSFDTGILNGNPTFTENGTPVILDSDVQIHDAELSAFGNYGGAALTLARDGGANSEDQFSGAGIVAGQANGDVIVSATTVGTYNYSSGTIVLTFNTNATQTLVNQAMQNIAYSNTSDAPPSNVTINWTFNDGNHGAQGDGGALAAIGSTTVNIIAVNDAPVVSESITLSDVAEDNGAITLTATQLLANSTDVDNDSLSVTNLSTTAGALADNGDGTWTLTPDANYNGTITLSYDITDGVVSVATTATQIVTAINDAPVVSESITLSDVAEDNGAITLTATQLLANATDVDNDSLSVVNLSTTAGALADNGDGTWTLTPDANYNGTITLNYDVTDGVVSVATTATQIVTAINDAPTFVVGDGKIKTQIGTYDDGRSVILQQDGKVLVAGTSDHNFALARYNSDGSLDTTFSEDGKVTTDISSTFDSGTSVVVQPDGKILIAGTGNYDFALVRYNSDGTLDTTFDGDGKVTTPVGPYADMGESVTLQTDGKIIVAGYSYSTSGEDDFSLVRYNSDGSLDTTFGSNGKVITSSPSIDDKGESVILQSDGKILVAGSSQNGGYYDFALARYNSDGSLDTTFDGDGKAMTDLSGSYDFAYSVAIQTDGKILVAGRSAGDSGYDLALIRYNSDGSLDTMFDSDGKVTTVTGVGNPYSITGISIQTDGKILVAGSIYNGSNDDFALIRYNSDGSLDTTFGFDGKVTTDFGSYDAGYSVALQEDGKIVVSGTSNNNFALARYNSDGNLDTTFHPVNTLDGNQTFTENGTPIILDSDVQIHDAELSALGNYGGAALTLARDGGANSEDQFSGAGIVAGQANGDVIVSATTVGTYNYSSGTIVLTFNTNATQTLVNQAMQNIAYSNTSDAPPANITINWTFNDGNYGAQGDGGALAAIGSTTVNIIAVNDAPTSLNTTVITNEDTAKALTLLDFPFNDIDTESALFNVKITTLPTKGTLTLDGVKVTANQEISTTDINSGKLIFTPEANANGSNYSFFGFEVSDGTAYSISANKVTINVTAVNDAPIITSGSAGTVEENVSLATIIYDANASDVDTGTTLNYSLSGTDTALLNIDSRSGKVTLKASANYEEKNSYDFNIIVSDGILNATKAVTVSVININEAPTSTNTTITTNEDTPTVLSLTNFAFNDVDVGSTFLKIKITTLPIKETLKLDGVAVTANQEISVADINSGKLIFTPKANANGTGYTSFEFKVSDGIAYSISANKITIDVTAVRDDMNLIGTSFNDTLNGDTIDKGSYDTLNGLAGNDILNGKLGNDTMTGGTGKDTFVFNTTLSTINIDTITDFNAADDTIYLENAIFTKLKAKGILNIDYFKADNTGNAIDGNDYILYNTSTGVLSYDADGNGTGSAIQIALIGTITHPTLSVSDFVVI